MHDFSTTITLAMFRSMLRPRMAQEPASPMEYRNATRKFRHKTLNQPSQRNNLEVCTCAPQHEVVEELPAES